MVGAYVDATLKHRLANVARRHDRTVSAEIRVALRRHLKEVSRDGDGQ